VLLRSAPYAYGVPVRDKRSRVEEKEKEIATLNLGLLFYFSLVFFHHEVVRCTEGTFFVAVA